MADDQQADKSATTDALRNQADAELEPLRVRIDEIDRKLIELLNERARIVVDVGKVKRDHHAPIYAPERESMVLEKVTSNNPGPLPNECIEAIWREMMSGSFALERPIRIGYLGPPGSFSHLAASKKFGASVEYDNLADITMIFEAIDRKHIDYGLVPIENSLEGFVTATLDCLLATHASICAEVLLAVHQNLLANCEAPEIKKIYSHPQALAQCRRWLGAQFPSAEKIVASSTSKGVELAAREPGAAAIGSKLAGKLYNVHVQFENIEDNPNNVTRFYVLAHQQSSPTGNDKTSLLFAAEHKSGALANVLDVFRDHGINLTHIDKRPSQRNNWEYVFFVDLFGHREDEQVAKAIEAAASHCVELRVLGSFPRAQQVLG